jgi:hypothetical protein
LVGKEISSYITHCFIPEIIKSPKKIIRTTEMTIPDQDLTRVFSECE